jgi:hypothetical protein
VGIVEGDLAMGGSNRRKANHQTSTISDSGEPSVSEDDCVCGHWPEADRSSMRILIDRLPLQEEVCDECSVAFWRNISFLDGLPLYSRSADKALMRHPAVPRLKRS